MSGKHVFSLQAKFHETSKFSFFATKNVQLSAPLKIHNDSVNKSLTHVGHFRNCALDAVNLTVTAPITKLASVCGAAAAAILNILTKFHRKLVG